MANWNRLDEFHSFRVDIANVVGVQKALILDSLWYRTRWAEKDGKLTLDTTGVLKKWYNWDGEEKDFAGYTWGTKKYWSDLFPYITPKTVYNHLNSLEQAGYIKKIKGGYRAKPNLNLWAIRKSNMKRDLIDFDIATVQNHKFNIKTAVELGINVAILMQHFITFLEHNRESDLFSFEVGSKVQTWTPASVALLKQYHPYLTRDEIRGALGKLKQTKKFLFSTIPNKKFGFVSTEKWITYDSGDIK
jgi:hypothetical protein